LDLPFRAGGDGERDGLVVYRRRRGGGERDTDSEGLRARRLGGGERDIDAERLRSRRFGGGERDRERLDDTSRLDLILRGAGERERDRDAEIYDALRPRPRALLRAGEGLRVYDRPRELDRESARLCRTGERDLERLDDV
jgi:hypothetical protein